MGRQDYETETLVAHTLRGEDGTGRGAPLVPVAFQTRGSNLHVGDISGTIGTAADRASGSAPMVAYAFDARQSDVLQYGDRAGALDTNGYSVAVAFTTEQTPKFSHDRALTLTKQSPTGGGQPQAVAVAVAPTLTAANDPSRSPQSSEVQQQIAAVHATTMQVRRLTPVECERLQGFPDGYTAIPWRGRPASECPDGPRYKALGNSMAVPVMKWLGERIAAVDQAG
jgi:DNA (cytosine-5)-methyltransferase 1